MQTNQRPCREEAVQDVSGCRQRFLGIRGIVGEGVAVAFGVLGENPALWFDRRV